MADLNWVATSPLSRSLTAGRHGAASGEAGVSFTEHHDFGLLQILARRGQAEAAAIAAQREFGVPPPRQPRAVSAGGTTLVWSGPDQFFVLAQSGSALSADTARELFAGAASVSDQSDGRALLRLGGPRVRDALAKVCALDLHPAVFPVDTAAAASIDHTGVTLWRGADAEDGTPVYFLLVFATFAESLAGTILDAAAEYGVATAREPWLA